LIIVLYELLYNSIKQMIKKCFYISIIDDFNHEDSETFEVVLLPNAGVILADPYVTTVTIIDDDSNRK